MTEEGIDVFGVGTIIAFVAAFIGDFSFLFIIALFVPIIGLVIAFFILCAHYVSGAVILILLWKKTRGWLAKTILFLAVLIPLPLLIIAIILAIILSKSAFLREAAEEATKQVVVQTIAVATGGAGEVLEAGAIAQEAGSVATQGAEALNITQENVSSVETEIIPEMEEGIESRQGAGREKLDETLGERSRETPRETAEKQEQERPGTLPSQEGQEEEAEGATDEEKRKQEELEEEMEPEAERSPEEVALEKLFESIPTTERQDEDEEEVEIPKPPQKNNNVVLPDEFAKRQKALQIEKQQKALKKAGEVTAEDQDIAA